MVNIQKLIEKKVSLKVDLIFKLVFSKDKEILLDLLRAIIGEEIEDIEIISKDFTLDRYRRDRKFGVLDIIATLNNGTYVNIEMQVEDYKNMINRLLFYQNKLHSDSILAGKNYNTVKKIIVIGIVDYDLFKEYSGYVAETEYHIHRKISNTKNIKLIDLNNKLKLYFIELPNFKKLRPDLNKKLDQWIEAIRCENVEEIKEVMEKNKQIKKAFEKIEELAKNEEIIEIMTKEEDDERNLNDLIFATKEEGRTEGRAEGLKNGKIKVAKKLLSEKYKIEEIARLTELDIEEIKKLKI